MVLVIDSLVAGISGDMMLSALVNLGADKEIITDGISAAGDFFDDVEVEKIGFVETSKCGTGATAFELVLNRDSHELNGAEIIRRVITASAGAGLAREASRFADTAIRKLVGAESKIHGKGEDSVILHEAAGFDTIADILGTAIALQDLHLFREEVLCTPVAVGGATASFSHGTVSNPAGGILEIFRGTGVVISGNKTGRELTTPTGASMLVALGATCIDHYPAMSVNQIGYGAGARDYEGFANVLKVVRGTGSTEHTSDEVAVLETNVDDASGEVLGHAVKRIFEGGARDVTISPATGKKGRPMQIVSVICDPGLADPLARIIISEIGTLGVRIRTERRVTADRSFEKTDIEIDGYRFSVRYKKRAGSGAYKIEADDIAAVSDRTGRSFADAERLIRGRIDGRRNT